MSDTMFPEPMDQMDRAMQRMDKKAWAEADAEIALLKARLAEAEALLREESHAHYRFTQMTEYPDVMRMLLWHMDRKRRIDAHLARKP